MPPDPTLAEIARHLASIDRRLARLESVVLPIVTKARSRTQQARAAGVSRTTLWRRERRARARLALDGRWTDRGAQ